MANNLGDLTPSNSYNDLFYLNNSNLGLTSDLKPLYSGNGTVSPIQLSTDKVSIDYGEGEIKSGVFNSCLLKFNDIGNKTGTYVLQTSNGNLQKITLTGDVDISISSDIVGDYGYEIILIVEQGAGSNVINFPAEYKISDGSTITFSSTIGDIDSLKFTSLDSGATWIVSKSNSTSSSSSSVTLTGDVTGTGIGSFATTIAANAVTLAKFQQIATASILGRNTASTGNIEVLSTSTVRSLLSIGSVENTALSTWAGTSSITTLGTIATGSWNATTITVGKGGTGTSTQFTLGSVVFAGTSGVYSQDNSNFFYDSTNHRLGLGTVSPNQQLELTGNIRAAASNATTPFNLYLGTTKFFHTYGVTASESTNIFIGPNSGNTTLTRGTAVRNIGIGRSCLTSLTTGSYNLAWGDQCGKVITDGTYNALIGDTAGYSMTGGDYNLAIGPAALYSCTTSDSNVGIGNGAGSGITTATYGNNVCIGGNAMRYGNVQYSVAIGGSSLWYTNDENVLTGDANIAIGYGSQGQYCTPVPGPTLTRAIAIGYYAVCSVTHGCVLGLWNDTSTVAGVGTHAPGAQWHTRANRAGQTALIADGFTSPTVDIAQFRTTTDGSLTGSGSGTWTTQLAVNKSGGLSHKSGSNLMAGSATLAAGTVTVSNTSVVTGDVIEFSRQSFNSSTAVGVLGITALTNGASFVITSKKSDSTTETNDVSIVWWRIVRPI